MLYLLEVESTTLQNVQWKRHAFFSRYLGAKYRYLQRLLSMPDDYGILLKCSCRNWANASKQACLCFGLRNWKTPDESESGTVIHQSCITISAERLPQNYQLLLQQHLEGFPSNSPNGLGMIECILFSSAVPTLEAIDEMSLKTEASQVSPNGTVAARICWACQLFVSVWELQSSSCRRKNDSLTNRHHRRLIRYGPIPTEKLSLTT